MQEHSLADYQEATQAIRAALALEETPRIGVVLGTGLGHWADSLQDLQVLPYAEIPHFPQSTVDSHSGRLVFGRIHSTPVLSLQGRFHLYEGYSPEAVCFGVRILGLLGVEKLVITNASGAINPHFSTGNIMLIEDQMNMSGHNPLRGPNCDAWGPRFPDMSRAFDPAFKEAALAAAGSLGLRLERGVYAGVMGPCLETPAETRALKRLGADAVGMSTVLEVIAARHMGLRLLGLSCLTNKNLPDCMEETSFEEVVLQANRTGPDLSRLLNEVLPRL